MSTSICASIVTNAFSLNMLKDFPSTVKVEEISLEQAKSIYCTGWETTGDYCVSAVGHEDTAEVFSSVLGKKVPMNRTSLSLEKGTVILVGQYRGPRLPEGCKTLPEGATIQWLLVTIE